HTSGSDWPSGVEASGRVIAFNNPSGEGALSFVRPASTDGRHAPYPLTDWLPYDETGKTLAVQADKYFLDDAYGNERSEMYVPRWNVSDLKIQFFYTRQSGDGPLRVRLTKLNDAFVAELTPKQVRLLHYRVREGQSDV